MALGDRDLVGRGTVLQQDVDHLFVFHLQLRDGFGEVEATWCRDSTVCSLARMESAFLRRPSQSCCTTSICGFTASGLGGGDVLSSPLTRMFQRFSKSLRASFRSLNASPLPAAASVAFFADLRQDAQFAGMADVLLVMVRLGVEVGKVGEQQHDRDDEDDEQPAITELLRMPAKSLR